MPLLIVTALLLLVIAEAPAEAYVDPGSASYVFQLIAGAVLGSLYLVRMYWDRLVSFFRTRGRGSRPLSE
jgi:hypothetical protein